MQFFLSRCLFLSLSLYIFSTPGSSQTLIKKEGEQWQLAVDGNPFEIKGVTFGYDHDVENYDAYFQELKFLGVNSIRTWGTSSNTPKLLDTAHKYGIKVMLGIWMRHGRPGAEADDSFDYVNDESGKEIMYADALATVEQYKDHPAILMWGIGNEVYLNIATDNEKLIYSNLLEKICKQIKIIDRNHPILSVEAWTFGIEWWTKYVPSVDIYGINTYGAGANILPQEIAKKGGTKPYIITEFGVRGEWDIDKDNNGVKPEPSDTEKYDAITTGYNEWIKGKPGCMGVYVFHYSNDNHFVAPWLLTHVNGMKRPQFWAIREAYTGQKPLNHVPSIENFQLPKDAIKSNSWVPVSIKVSDKEQEVLNYKFFYNQRSGSRKRRDQLTPLTSRGSTSEGLEIQVPSEHGGVKIYAMVSDTYGNVGIASTSISVIDKKAKKRKYLVPRSELPFYVYQDGGSLPYAPSAYMGNYLDMEVDMNYTESSKSGRSCIKINYKTTSDWYGLGIVDPPGDWGDILGGYDISGAKKLSFWAKSTSNINVTAGLGLIKPDKPFPDSAIKTSEITLTTEWKKYTIKLNGINLSCVRSGFVIFVGGTGIPHEIYLDDIVYE